MLAYLVEFFLYLLAAEFCLFRTQLLLVDVVLEMRHARRQRLFLAP